MADSENVAKPENAADPATKVGEEKEEGGGEGAEEVHYESTAVFTPVVQLAEVETKTHEENEDVLYKQRGKLFVFGEAMLDRGSGKKSWLERGIGEVKLLRHRENKRIRMLMRQEKTMKVIANHMVDPRIVMQPNVGSDRSWVWTAYDFSEGELREEVFALKFGKPQDAEDFKNGFDAAKKEMREFVETVEEEPRAEGDAAAAGDVADALAGLKVDKDKEKFGEAGNESKSS